MELRSGHVVGSTALPPQARPAFEEGVRLLFRQWTALALAVENQWGGATSTDKANWLVQESINWFYRNKEHYWDDLAEELDDALVQDFNVEAEDGSPDEMAKSMVAFYEDCVKGDFSKLTAWRAQAARPSAVQQSRQQVVDMDGTVMGEEDGSDSSSGDEEDDGMDEDGAVAPQGVPLRQPRQPQEPQAPLIDEDGFEMVQGRGGRRGRR